MLKIHMQVILMISTEFAVEMCFAAQNRQKTIKAIF